MCLTCQVPVPCRRICDGMRGRGHNRWQHKCLLVKDSTQCSYSIPWALLVTHLCAACLGNCLCPLLDAEAGGGLLQRLGHMAQGSHLQGAAPTQQAAGRTMGSCVVGVFHPACQVAHTVHQLLLAASVLPPGRTWDWPALSSILPRWPEPPLRSSAASSTSAFMPVVTAGKRGE